MKLLSVAIITFNEEKNIKRCLESIESIADEIIIIDSFSTDKTKEISLQFKNVRFIEQRFLGYIEQKNFALQKTSNSFVLSLDADEALDKTLLQNIEIEKVNGFAMDGYTMNRCSNFCGKWIKHGTWYPDVKLRLFNKEKGYWGGTNPHDKVVLNSHTTTKQLTGDILHYTYYTIEEMIAQMNMFTTIQAEAMYKKGQKANWIKLFISPTIAFINGYIFKAGFLDGKDGFTIAKTVAYQTHLKYAKLKKLQEGK
jgi:glycosyltransferase involved in cell wall biosynthesis